MARPRGRPRGTGIDDTARLAAAWRLMAKDNGASFTSALKRTGTRNPSDIRRCQGKRRASIELWRRAWAWPKNSDVEAFVMTVGR